MDSILTSVKEMLGITEDYEVFDLSIITAINTAFSALTQLGVGPAKGYSIKDKNDLWSDFIEETPRLEMIKSYIHLKVKMLFDPPLGSASIDATNHEISELEWRINIAADSIDEEIDPYHEKIKKIEEDIDLLKQHDILSSSLE